MKSKLSRLILAVCGVALSVSGCATGGQKAQALPGTGRGDYYHENQHCAWKFDPVTSELILEKNDGKCRTNKGTGPLYIGQKDNLEKLSSAVAQFETRDETRQTCTYWLYIGGNWYQVIYPC